MPRVALLLLQTATTVAAPAASTPDDRLLHPVPPAHCTPSANQILVCAKDSNSYRLQQSGPQFDTSEALPKAEWKVFGNAKMGVEATQRSLPGVGSAPAGMVTLKVPF